MQPRTARDLAQAVKVCADFQTPFAVKSGGHGHFAGQSSITGGVQLDLAKLNVIAVNNEKTAVWVGSGNSWAAVYKKLEKMGRIAVGGRAASVGVGGFILGGMLSLFICLGRDVLTVRRRHITLRCPLRLGDRQCALLRSRPCRWKGPRSPPRLRARPISRPA